ncbi:hypothetical protein TWF106_000967 [Orbilia oligospora]|uniref:Uncharacterized protein n=1 Tax=Orbilia oligospora TaxID=2813651 RepID=A0A6G1M4B6_ORBOL|nr:hypothetical protein TWF788_011109 [Orbilia oligospora]KAF3205981.1 hypothetical protein TWF106_000967 [Orbilia oligospora]KAF3216537.1 hypothetical protein TWF191_009023 [Orbilia oligospora]KAF3245043.1 hypothetical protein TWF192_007566 [Orbilia oligospora]
MFPFLVLMARHGTAFTDFLHFHFDSSKVASMDHTGIYSLSSNFIFLFMYLIWVVLDGFFFYHLQISLSSQLYTVSNPSSLSIYPSISHPAYKRSNSLRLNGRS